MANERHLVLVGGGHAHALVLRHWRPEAVPGLRITLVNPSETAPYSGMLPGHIAGHYPREALEIDLARLARFAGAELIVDQACDLDAPGHRVRLREQGWLEFDLASIDIGITNRMPSMPGFADHAVPAKPMDGLAQAWQDFLSKRATLSGSPRIAVIGGGIAGVELSMAMGFALRQIGQHPEVTVLEAGSKLAGVPPLPARLLARKMAQRGIALRLNAEVREVTAQGCTLRDGEEIEADFVLGAAGATPHEWLAETGVALHDGSLVISPDLSLRDHPSIFAVGDCAHIAHAPRPKAGVYAVRAAPVLAHNLVARLTGEGELRRFEPQRDYLKLVSLGQKSALAMRSGLAFSGPLLWRWKDRIDRRFMDLFHDLPNR